MKLLLIRHGMTAGNREKRYIGITDDPLCEEGIVLLRAQAEAIAPEEYPKIVFISPLIRCRQTADILFPGVKQVVIGDLAEADFGIFENRAYKGDLEFSPEYARWVDSMCEDPIPGGESKASFTARCRKGFEEALRLLPELASVPPQSGLDATSKSGSGQVSVSKPGSGPVAFVVHGGTIMAIMSLYAEGMKDFYEWNLANGRGYTGEWDGTAIRNIEEYPTHP